MDTNNSAPEISVVVPLFNEQENIAELQRRLTRALESLKLRFEIIYINDGSRDQTPAMLDRFASENHAVVVVHLSRNFGHQAAVSAGLDHARGCAVIVMDGDLQDPPEVLGAFIDRWRQGFDVVYAIRTKRKENMLKRAGYYIFYRLLRSASDLNIPLDSGDFCLLDRRVVETMKQLPERLRFVRGLRTFVGFRQTGLCYERAAREAGKPKYTLRGLMKLAVDGFISFSNLPLQLVTWLGLLSASIAIALSIWVVSHVWTHRVAPSGWSSTLIIVLFMGSVQLLCLGIIGEYLRRIFLEVKGRPTYIIDQVVRQAHDNHPADSPELRRPPSRAA